MLVVEKKVHRLLVIGVIVIATLVGVNVGGQAVNAKANYYKTVPTALRGSWYTTYWKSDGYPKVGFTFTKYVWKQQGQTLSMKGPKNNRLGIYKTKAGYYRVGIAHGDMPEHLKPVKHNGKKALRSYWFDVTNHDKLHYIYYYRK